MEADYIEREQIIARIRADIDSRKERITAEVQKKSKINTSPKAGEGKWSSEEDEALKKAIEIHGEKNWKVVSTHVPNRSPLQCLHRWTKVLRPGIAKGKWTSTENRLLRDWVAANGPQKWSDCAKVIKTRNGKQCRDHWLNKLNPELKKGNWTQEEDSIIYNLYKKYGTSWVKIQKHLPGRTENDVKNRYYSTLRRIELRVDKNKKVKKEEINGECSDVSEPHPTAIEDLSEGDTEEIQRARQEGERELKKSMSDKSMNLKELSQERDIETKLTNSLACIPRIKSNDVCKQEDSVSEEFAIKIESSANSSELSTQKRETQLWRDSPKSMPTLNDASILSRVATSKVMTTRSSNQREQPDAFRKSAEPNWSRAPCDLFSNPFVPIITKDSLISAFPVARNLEIHQKLRFFESSHNYFQSTSHEFALHPLFLKEQKLSLLTQQIKKLDGMLHEFKAITEFASSTFSRIQPPNRYDSILQRPAPW